jgi:hypothetical protein
MSMKETHLQALRALGYTDREARFLYIVATHSGYFTQAHFFSFIGCRSFSAITSLLKKLSDKQHARRDAYQNNLSVHHLFARVLYRAVGKEHIRARHRHSLDYVRTRLAVLDFVLANPQFRYLETEEEKVQFFEDYYGINRAHVPGKVYRGALGTTNATRYFVDKFPMFLTNDEGSSKPVVTFTFVDPGRLSQLPFITHLDWYGTFFARLKQFHFVYVSPDRANFPKAETEFKKRVMTTPPNAIRKLIRYFQLRELEDTKQYSKISLTDLDFIAQAKKIFAREPFESLYQRWKKNEIWDAEIQQELDQHYGGKLAAFSAFLLPRSYAEFEQNSHFFVRKTENRPEIGSPGGSPPGSPQSASVTSSED